MALRLEPFTVALAAAIGVVLSATALVQLAEMGEAGAAPRPGLGNDAQAHAELARRWQGPQGRAVAAAATRNDLGPVRLYRAAAPGALLAPGPDGPQRDPGLAD